VLERLSEGDFDLRAEVLTGVQEGRSDNLPTPYTSLKGSGRGCPLLRASSDHVSIMLLPSLLVTSLGMGLTDLPLRASNEGLLRPRVARAQKIIRLYPAPFFSILPLTLEIEHHIIGHTPLHALSTFRGSLLQRRGRGPGQ
jgi:hypothetical protein